MNGLTIARYFSVGARQAAVSATYTTRSAGTPEGTYRRTRYGQCPVGVMLAADGYSGGLRCPDVDIAASAILAHTPGERDRHEGQRLHRTIAGAVARFNQMWDAGEIGDLRAALGLSGESVSPDARTLASATIRRKRATDGAGPETAKIAYKTAAML